MKSEQESQWREESVTEEVRRNLWIIYTRWDYDFIQGRAHTQPPLFPLSFSHWAFIFSSLTKINVDNFIKFFQLNIFTFCFTCHHRWRREKERKEQKMEGDPSFSPYKPVYWTGKQHRYVFVYFLHLKRVCLTVCWQGCDLKSVFILCFFCLFVFLLQTGDISASVRNSLSDDFSSVFSVRPDRNSSDASSCWMRW